MSFRRHVTYFTWALPSPPWMLAPPDCPWDCPLEDATSSSRLGGGLRWQSQTSLSFPVPEFPGPLTHKGVVNVPFLMEDMGITRENIDLKKRDKHKNYYSQGF